MNGRKTLGGLALLAALASLAFAAPSAFAATSGTTAVTCVEGATKDFSDAHCAVPKSPGTFGHKVLPETVTKEVTGTNANTQNETKESTPVVLRSTAGGLETEIVCTSASSSGTIENKLVGEVHSIVGSGGFVTYSSCTVPKPAGQNCEIKGGEIKTNELKGESEAMGGKIQPATGTTFTTITFAGCKTAGLNKAYAIGGSINVTGSGATAIANIPKNAESTLEFGGQKAGLTFTTTVKMAGGNPLTATTSPFTVG